MPARHRFTVLRTYVVACSLWCWVRQTGSKHSYVRVESKSKTDPRDLGQVPWYRPSWRVEEE